MWEAHPRAEAMVGEEAAGGLEALAWEPPRP